MQPENAQQTTERLAQVLATTLPDDLPDPVFGHAHRAVLDWLGSVLGGASEPPARMARQVAGGLGASGEATMFGAGRAAAAVAAFGNGVAAHILELDDIHHGSTVHAAAPIVSAALAVAEREAASGRALLAAVALGYEAAFRIGEAVNPSHYRLWHPTGTVATFGAAAAAGALLRLGPSRMVHALGSAGTQAAGLWEFNASGAMSKHLHPGKAAFNGVLAADLARAGFTGASRILEGDRGFFRAMSRECDPARVTDGLGVRWKIGENSYKLHACCGHTHTAIDAALSVRARCGWQGAEAVDRIAAIQVETYGPGYAIVKEMRPSTPYRAKFSMAYCVAVALLEGAAGLEQFTQTRFTDDRVRDPALAALLARTRVTVAEDLTSLYPAAWPARLTITLLDGSTWEDARDHPRGSPVRPADTEALREKLMAIVEPRSGGEVARAALRAVDALPQCDNVARLFGEAAAALRPHGASA